MKLTEDLCGIITVLNTPFCKELRVDWESMKKNISYIINARCKGILYPAMASEVHKLTIEEHLSLVKFIKEEIGDSICLIAGVSHKNFNETLFLADTFSKLDLPILINLTYSTEDKLINHLLEIDSLKPKFIMLQDWSTVDYGIPVKTIAKAFEKVPSFQSYKIEVQDSCRKYSEVLAITNGELHLAGGWAVLQMLEGLSRGVHSFMPTGMHEVYTTIYNEYKTNRNYAENLFDRILPVLAFSNQYLDLSIHFFKYLLHEQGIYSTPLCREPILPLDNISKIFLRKHISNAMSIIRDLNSR